MKNISELLIRISDIFKNCSLKVLSKIYFSYFPRIFGDSFLIFMLFAYKSQGSWILLGILQQYSQKIIFIKLYFEFITKKKYFLNGDNFTRNKTDCNANIKMRIFSNMKEFVHHKLKAEIRKIYEDFFKEKYEIRW